MSDHDDDALFESLENEYETDPAIAHLREARIQQLSTDLSRARVLRNEGYGVYAELKDEKQAMDVTTSHKKCVLHFFKSDFNRCRIMDQHLKQLAEQHLEARVCRINVENAPFLVTKLNVKVLPCVIAFVDGVSVDRIVGFEGLGIGQDSFETLDLEQGLRRSGVLDDSFSSLDGLGTSRDAKHNWANSNAQITEDDDDWD